MNTFSRKLKVSAIGASVILGLGVSAAIMIPSANAQNPSHTIPKIASSSIHSVLTPPPISKMPTGSTAGDDSQINDGPEAISLNEETDNQPSAINSTLPADNQPVAISSEGESENNSVPMKSDSENND